MHRPSALSRESQCVAAGAGVTGPDRIVPGRNRVKPGFGTPVGTFGGR
jgi:hypothetical protein